MKKLILSISFFIVLVNLTAQVIYHRTSNLNIGFGTSSDVKGNRFMDFCVNGPLVGEDGLPVGGYLDNGVTVKNWISPETGGGNFSVRNSIFGLGNDGKMHMVSFEEKNTLPTMVWAIQNGPTLIMNGANVCGQSQSKFSRSGIGYRADNTIVVIVSTTPRTFYEFAQLFVDEGCVNAIYLDGGNSYCGFSNKKGSFGNLNPSAVKLQFFNN